SAQAHGLDRRGDRGVAGDDDHGDLGMFLADRPQDFHPADISHFEIRENHIKLFLANALKAFLAIKGPDHLMALTAQDLFAALADDNLIIDNENSGWITHTHKSLIPDCITRRRARTIPDQRCWAGGSRKSIL